MEEKLEKLKTLLYSLERSPKISSVLYKDSQYVLENMQGIGKYLLAGFCLQKIIRVEMSTFFHVFVTFILTSFQHLRL